MWPHWWGACCFEGIHFCHAAQTKLSDQLLSHHMLAFPEGEGVLGGEGGRVREGCSVPLSSPCAHVRKALHGEQREQLG